MASSGSLSTTGYKGRHLVLSWEQVSQSITDNTTTISWTLKGAGSASFSYCYARNFTVIINGTTVYYAQDGSSEVKLYDGTVVASGTLTIAHNTDGSKSFSASVAAGIYDWSPTCTGSGTFYLNNIPRLSSLTANNGTLGTAQTLTVTRQSTSFTHTITYKCGTASGTIASKTTSTSISWTPPMALASQNTTGTVVSVTFTIETYSGNNSVGSSSRTISCSIPDSVIPSCMLNTERVPYINNVYDADWWSSRSIYIQGLTKVQASVVASTSYGSPISNYTVKMDNLTYSGQNVTMAAPTKSGNVTITATVIDKRGRSGTVTKTISVLPCSPCRITKLTGIRCDSDGTANDRGQYIFPQFEFSSGFFNTEYGLNAGSATADLYYKKHSDYSWTSLAAYDDCASWPNSDYNEKDNVFKANTEDSYDLKLVVTDFFTTATITARVGTAYSIMHWKASGRGLGIGKASELDDVLDIGMSTKFSGGITPIEIESGTDLNDVVLPNVYYGNGLPAKYPNFPISSTASIGFCIEVLRSGSNEIKQRLTTTQTFTPNDTKVYERIRGFDLSGNAKWSSWASTNGIVPITRGGTGATTADQALANLGALPLAGGTMVNTGTNKGCITHPGNSVYFYKGRDGAVIRRPNAITSSEVYYPLVSSKTVNGDWTIGTLSDDLYFNYTTDTRYNGGSETIQQFIMGKDGHLRCPGGAVLLATGTLGASASSTISGGFNGYAFKNLLILIRSIANSGNKYSSFALPAMADVWGLFLPTYNDYYRVTATITGSGSSMSCMVQMDSNVSGAVCWIYATA